ncbi:MAG: transcriptional repressor [Synergistaceae bacterium]|jgi:Fe2+ or Zn2+ uptake regulation protein|nr:transcriptional repressor [Synergistaceae bacterium]
MTHTQNEILAFVMNSNQHLTAERIYQELKVKLPNIALGTVYRNLNQFADNNQIRRVRRANAPDFFERNLLPHQHKICARCGRMSDVSIADIAKWGWGEDWRRSYRTGFDGELYLRGLRRKGCVRDE